MEYLRDLAEMEREIDASETCSLAKDTVAYFSIVLSVGQTLPSIWGCAWVLG